MTNSGGQKGRFESHRNQQVLENIDFLRSVNLHDDQIAKRLGLTRDQMDKMLERRASAERDPASTAGSSEATGERKVPPLRRPGIEG